MAQNMLRLIERMLSTDGDRMIVIRSFARICTSFANFGAAEHKGEIVGGTWCSILRCSSSEQRC